MFDLEGGFLSADCTRGWIGRAPSRDSWTQVQIPMNPIMYVFAITFSFFPQTDVFGACPTEVSSSQEGGAVLIHRTRDLSRCAHREQTRSELITAVYNPTAVSSLQYKYTAALLETLGDLDGFCGFWR